jgi:hypothetical protein
VRIGRAMAVRQPLELEEIPAPKSVWSSIPDPELLIRSADGANCLGLAFECT